MRLLPLVTLVALLATAPRIARAQGQAMSAQCGVTEVLASNEKKGLDAKLDKYKALLGTPPYKSWDSFTLLGDHDVTIERQKPSPVKLEGGTITLLYKDKLVEEGGKARVRVGVDLDDAKGKRLASTVLVFGSATVVGGPPYKGGTQLIIVACSAK